MAELLWRRGHITTTTAKIVVRSDTDGVITLSGDFTGDSATADTATVTDGVVTLTATGLVADTEYFGTVTHADGSSESVKFKTAPVYGSFDIVWGSCQTSEGTFDSGPLCSLDVNPIAGFWLGDIPYANAGKDVYENCPDTDTDLVTATNQAVYNAHHRNVLRNPGWAKVGHEAAYYYTADDHEWPGDNWDHSITGAQKGGLSGLTQSDVDDIFNTGYTAYRLFASGNADNNDAEASAEFPKYAGVSIVDAGTPESNYPPAYFRLSIADAELFILSCIPHRSNTASVDDSRKTMLGATQLAWLKTRLISSTKTFKIILTGKSMVGTTNSDTFNEYKNERNNILKFLLNSTREAADKTTYGNDDVLGVVFLSGDQHTPHVSRASVDDGDNYTYLDVCACPIGTKLNNTISGPGGERVWSSGYGQVFGHVRVEGSEYMEIRIVALDGRKLWVGRIYAGSNEMVYPHSAPAVSV